MPSSDTPLLSTKQVAAELSITERAVRHRIVAGTLAAEKVGDGLTSSYVIARTEVERLKAEGATEASA